MRPGRAAFRLLTGADPGLPSVYRVGASPRRPSPRVASRRPSVSACARAPTAVTVEMRRALAAFRSERYLRIDDGPPPALRDPVTGFYETRDGRWIQLHTNFAHHLHGRAEGARMRRTIAPRSRRDSQLGRRRARSDARRCGPVRRVDPHARRMGRARPGESDRAAAALRNRAHRRCARRAVVAQAAPGAGRCRACGCSTCRAIIAGPVAGRALAHHGAHVLLINGPHLPNIAPLVIDNGRGKRSAVLDLRAAAGRETLQRLLRPTPTSSFRRIAQAHWLRAASVQGTGARCGRHRLCVGVRVWARRAVGAATRFR